MADSQMDIIKSDPIDALNQASKVSLQGGGALLLVGCGLLYQVNEAGWKVGEPLVYVLFGAAILMGLVAASFRVIDAFIRYRLASTLLSIKGTSDPKVAAGLPVISQQTADKTLGDLIGNGGPVFLLMDPNDVPTASTDSAS